jgi:hypothetical protein
MAWPVIWPVIWPASADSRNAASAATSSGVAMRPVGVRRF